MSSWKKNTVLFLASQTITLFGSSLVQYAIMWYITLNTKSGLMMTIAIVFGFVPTFLLSPFAGVWADRYDRKRLIIWSDSFIALATLIMLILFLMGHGSITLLILMSAIRAAGGGIQMPAVGAFLPQLVPEEKLMKVNGINGSIQSLIMLASPMVSGALLTVATIESIFLIDIVTAAIGVGVLLLCLKVPKHKRAEGIGNPTYFKDLAAGVTYIKQHPFVKRFFIFMSVFMFMVAPVAFLTPLQVVRTFGSEVWRLTAIEIAFSLGMTVGGLMLVYWEGFSNRIHTMTLSAVGMGLCTLGLGMVSDFWVYLGIMLLCGVALPFFNTPSTVLLQETVDPDYMGRVFGVMTMITSSAMPFGMLVFGPVADYVKIEWLLIGTGVFLFLQSFALLASKELVKAGRTGANKQV